MNIENQLAFPSRKTTQESPVDPRTGYTESTHYGPEGMTLRQYYAGLALPAIIASVDKLPSGTLKERTSLNAAEFVAVGACHYADALITELSRERDDAGVVP